MPTSNDNTSEELTAFLADYRSYIDEDVKPTQLIVRKLLKDWKTARAPTGGIASESKSPVAFTECRVKDPASVVDKIRRKSGDYPGGLCRQSMQSMPDILGCRVVVHFPSDLAYIHELIEGDPGLEHATQATAYYPEDRLYAVGMDEDLVVRRKTSGYRSIHYVLRYRQVALATSRVPFELQVRTFTDHVWAAIEHFLAYKPGANIPASVHKQFALLSAHLSVVDAHFDVLNDEIQRLQKQTRLRKRDSLDTSRLPILLKELGVGYRQKDVDRMLKMLVSNGISKVADLRRAAQALSPEQIVNTYRQVFGRSPNNFTIVAIWALYAASQQTGNAVEPTALVTLAENYAMTYKELV
jgi:ppGpp synthetase/RelA/SpoT-type nucleotidyltranferase